MAVSSRTPEGLPNRCPVCNSRVTVEPSSGLGDAPCPACGHLLWFIVADGTLWVYKSDALPPAVKARLVPLLKKWPLESEDSLDQVEWWMEIEAALDGFSIPDEEAEQIRAPHELIEYLIHKCSRDSNADEE